MYASSQPVLRGEATTAREQWRFQPPGPPRPRRSRQSRGGLKAALFVSGLVAVLTLVALVSLLFPAEANANGNPYVESVEIIHKTASEEELLFPGTAYLGVMPCQPHATGMRVNINLSGTHENLMQWDIDVTVSIDGTTMYTARLPKQDIGPAVDVDFPVDYHALQTSFDPYISDSYNQQPGHQVAVDMVSTCRVLGCPYYGDSWASSYAYNLSIVRFLKNATTVPPKDVASTSTFFEAINGMAAEELIAGYPVSGGWEFRPGNPVLRAQYAKMIVGALGLPLPPEGVSLPFTDLGPDTPGDPYPHQYVAAAYQKGIIKGKTATTFDPWGNVTRSQAVTMVVRSLQNLYPSLLKPVPAGYTPSWGTSFDAEQAPLAALAEYNGLLDKLSLTADAKNPFSPMPRQEVAQILWNVMQRSILTVSGNVTGSQWVMSSGSAMTEQKGPPAHGAVFLTDKNGDPVAVGITDSDGDYALCLGLGWARGWTKDGFPGSTGDADVQFERGRVLGQVLPDHLRPAGEVTVGARRAAPQRPSDARFRP